jgi:gliding motility-associated-like protein
LDAGNAGATYLWQDGSTAQTFNATSIGKYYVRVTNATGCVNSDTITISLQPKGNTDFYFKQDVCDPLNVQFFGPGSNLTNPYWNFGDGNTTTSSLNTAHTYAAYGNYTVKFGVENGACKDTVTKDISINVTWSDIIFTPDTTICFNGTGQLRAQPALNFCWSPTTYLDNPNISNPVTSTPGNITYYYTAQVPGNNLVVNSDFSYGNAGFGAGYLYTTRNINEGEYTVGANPQSWNALLGTCTDHTTGTGNMLLVNGANKANVAVWNELINVTPNTNYAFSAWLQNINVNNATSNPAQLQFTINGNIVGNIIQGRNAMCIWDQFYTTWNSGNNTTANISIVNQNTVSAGNDFALDDISFAPVSILRDSVKVMVDTPVVKTINDTTICKSSAVPLQATGGTTWSWSPATGLSDATISNPIATPLSNTQYIVTGTNLHGCTAKDTVQINLFPDLMVNLGPDTTDCAINNLVLDAGNAGSTYLWQDGSTAQTFTANSFGKYYVQVTDANGCINSDTIVASKSVNRLGDFTYKINACDPQTVQFTGTGSNLQNLYWNFDDGNTITNGNLATSHTYAAYGDYTVQFGMESGNCKDTATHTISVHVTPANIILTADTTICFNTSKQLQSQPAQNFCWSPVTYLNNPNIPNPVTATPQTIKYYYTAEINGVILRDSVTISVDTPVVKTNNDTTICKDRFVQLQATGAATWSWSPVTGLSNTAISNPVATPTATTEYIVTGTTINGCSANDTVMVNMYPIPTVISNHDITDCPNTPVQLAANSALTSWSWTPAGTLNNAAIANPVATPGVNTKYLVKVTDANNCSYTDSVNVQLLFTDFSVSIKGGAVCKGGSVNLKASGGDSYLWSPAGSLDNAALSSPMATPDTSTTYSVYVTENTCNTDTTMKVLVTVNPSPAVTAEKANDLDCITHSTRLSASGSSGNSYVWSPVSGLDHPNSPNPVSTTNATITYVVAATNQFGCIALDSVTVLVNSTGKVSFEVPNAFTPNGDGRNDCFGVKTWGGVELEEFSVFNRWGQRVFSSTKTNPCWDGRFNGELQPSGAYVYVIKAKTYCGPLKRTGTVILVK